jgi:hypothetical protein
MHQRNAPLQPDGTVIAAVAADLGASIRDQPFGDA